MHPIVFFAALTAAAADASWTTDVVGAAQERFAAADVADCHGDITARVTASGVLLTLDLPETGRRTEQCDDALLGSFRGLTLTAPPASLLVDDIAVVVVPLGTVTTTTSVIGS